MKRTACMAAAFICAATLAMAQTPATTTSSSASTTTGNDKITVSGCLQGDSQSSTTTASTSTLSRHGPLRPDDEPGRERGHHCGNDRQHEHDHDLDDRGQGQLAHRAAACRTRSTAATVS